MITSKFIPKIAVVAVLAFSAYSCAQNHVDKGQSYLMYAIDDGDLTLARNLIEKGEDLNTENFRGYTPLLLAAAEGELEIITLLLKKGVPINYKSSKNLTALDVACKEGNYEVVKLLLDLGANINPKTTLMSSVSGENYSVVELILANKKIDNVNTLSKQVHFCCTDSQENSYKIEWTNWSPLLESVHENNLEIAEILIKKGADVNLDAVKTNNRFSFSRESTSGWKPIFEAIQNENEAMISLLMKSGTDINSKLSTGVTLLQFAKNQGNESVIRVVKSYMK